VSALAGSALVSPSAHLHAKDGQRDYLRRRGWKRLEGRGVEKWRSPFGFIYPLTRAYSTEKTRSERRRT